MAKQQKTQSTVLSTPKVLDALSGPRNMAAVELPKYLTTREFLTPICIWEAENPKDGLEWGFYKDEKVKTFTNNCHGCHGSYETLYAQALYCPWCGAELDPDKAELFGEATL